MFSLTPRQEMLISKEGRHSPEDGMSTQNISSPAVNYKMGACNKRIDCFIVILGT